MSRMVLECINLEKRYGSHMLFTGLNLALGKAEIIGILGTSGRGKSSLLKIAAGLVAPTKGKCRVHAGPVGYVFQEPRLLPWYSALDNVALALLPLGYTISSARQRAGQFLDQMGLSGFETHYPGTLSGGMNQRVSIARALAVSPKLLLLDEPFTGLDPDLRASVRDRMENVLAKTRAGVIHVTHAKEELMTSTNRIFTLTAQGLVPMEKGGG
ncbi:MAG: ATP-binding cassette domain-containing protein [Desulfobacterales bacterium]|nr:ATP-binding cassette domain-containing protein [Desulfobacterales bacterium]